MRVNTAKHAWLVLDGKRQGILSRAELCCKYTLPRIWTNEGEQEDTTASTYDYQSVGALCVSHMSNRTVLTLFPPSRGFFRLEPPAQLAAIAEQLDVSETEVGAAMAKAERKAFKFLENSLQRPKLTRIAELLLATGNCLVLEEDDTALRVLSMRYYAIQRTRKGNVKCLIIREKVKFEELEDSVQAMLAGRFHMDQDVEFFTWVERQSGGWYKETQWVNEIQLPPNKFGARYANEEALPYHALTWSLADNRNYGSGLVEDYLRDFIALSAVSQAATEGSVACSQNRILVDPGSTTKPDDFNQSVNNQAIPGTPETVQNIALGNPTGVQVSISQADQIERRLRQAFMLTSGIIRQAERLTAYEIRKMAEEMDIQHGGSYSALSGTIQPWMARWCMRGAKLEPIYTTESQIRLVTGTDAMSRGADVDNLRLAFEDLTTTQNLPQEVRSVLDWRALVTFIGDGRQTPLSTMILNQQQEQANTNTAIANTANATYATTAAQTAAQTPTQ